MEGLENEFWRRWNEGKVGEWALLTAHFTTLPLLYLRHSSFSNPSFTSPTSQALHLLHLTSRPWKEPLWRASIPGIYRIPTASACVMRRHYAFKYTQSLHVINGLLSVERVGNLLFGCLSYVKPTWMPCSGRRLPGACCYTSNKMILKIIWNELCEGVIRL